MNDVPHRNSKEVINHDAFHVCAAVSGLRTHQLRMDVIGNNIANVNTAGFKKSGGIQGCLLPGHSRGSAPTDAREAPIRRP